MSWPHIGGITCAECGVHLPSIHGGSLCETCKAVEWAHEKMEEEMDEKVEVSIVYGPSDRVDENTVQEVGEGTLDACYPYLVTSDGEVLAVIVEPDLFVKYVLNPGMSEPEEEGDDVPF